MKGMSSQTHNLLKSDAIASTFN